MTRAVERAIAFAEWTVRRGRILREPVRGAFGPFSTVGVEPFLDPGELGWTSLLESYYPAIRAEAEHVLRVRRALPNFQDVAPDWIRLTDDDQWKLFWFVGYGVWDDSNCLRCPTAAVLRAIPGLITGFSPSSVRASGCRRTMGRIAACFATISR